MYMTFGEFNNDSEDKKTDNNEKIMIEPYQQQLRPQDMKLPIRQHITQPRNPQYVENMFANQPQQISNFPREYYNMYPSQMYSPQMYPPPSYPQNPYNEKFTMYSPNNMTTTSVVQNLTPIYSSSQNPYQEKYASSPLEIKKKPIISYDDEKEEFKKHEVSPSTEMSCIDVNDHIQNCPICSNYYKNYNYIYLTIIGILIFIIILFILKNLK